ncbi:MAG TPA: hypothetical protein VFW93_06070 [Aquabacterium sp.]|uniref:hypothetical protein n=1 Tax=Aquabacterium sp. TaxID=1872578 RepID=UPI002E2FA614|nr:hypothetical protein [Aquabacterium sp.]HEX5355761.1 hypothetical protein [Aquabacterium sp.]
MKHITTARLTCTMIMAMAAASHHAQAQSWNAIDLGVSTATALNEAGQVVGFFSTASGATHAFATGANGSGFVDLGTLGGTNSRAWDINNAGQIVGAADTAGGTSNAFITTANAATLTNLGTFGGTNSYANGINNNGQVLVGYTAAGASRTALLTLSTTSTKELTPYGYSGHYLVAQTASASSLNDLGTVVGSKYESCNCTANAYVFQGPGYLVTGSSTMDSSASDVNNQNQVVGRMNLTQGSSGPAYRAGYAVLSSAGGSTFQDIGTLGGASAYANGINNAGQIVGAAATASGQFHAFLTGPGGVNMLDLNSLVSLTDGSYLTGATDLNDLGQIIASASNGHSYLLSAVPEPSTLALGLLSGLALALATAQRRRQK